MNQITRVRFLRITGISEGISFLVLLAVAMPLKYFFGYPVAVKVVGWIHGMIFILYVIAILLAIKPMNWRFPGIIIAFVASLLPFGTFVLDRKWKKREIEIKADVKSA